MLGWEVIPRIGFGNFTISPHGLGIALGYFVGTLLLARRARARGFSEDHAWNAAAISVVGAILGARIAYVAGHFSEFDGPLEWLQIYKGGISLIGGLIGGFLAAYIYVRKQNLDFLQLADLGAPGIALGIAIGRIGDLIIGDHLGKATSGWWAWEFKGGELISPPPCIYPTVDGCIHPGVFVHQTALYDMIWSLAIFGLLMALDRKPRRKGFLTLTWASLYAVGRIATDFTRVDKEWFGLGLTGSQLTSIAVLAVCLYFLFKQRQLEPAVAGVPAAAAASVDTSASPTRTLGKLRTPAPVDSALEPPPATSQQRRRAVPSVRTGERQPEAAPAAAAATKTEPVQQRRRPAAAAKTPASETIVEPPATAIEEAAAERESVFKASRERARLTTEPEEEAARPSARAARSGAPSASERARTSTRSERPATAKPKEEPSAKEEEDLEEFDWEP